MKSANFFKSTPYHLCAPCGAHRIPLGFTLISPTLLLLSSSISKSSNLLGLNVLADIFYSSFYVSCFCPTFTFTDKKGTPIKRHFSAGCHLCPDNIKTCSLCQEGVLFAWR